LFDDINALKPTFFATVPRILNRIHGKIMDSVNAAGGAKKWLFERAVAVKTEYLNTQGAFTHAFYDRVVFKKIKEHVRRPSKKHAHSICSNKR